MTYQSDCKLGELGLKILMNRFVGKTDWKNCHLMNMQRPQSTLDTSIKCWPKDNGRRADLDKTSLSIMPISRLEKQI